MRSLFLQDAFKMKFIIIISLLIFNFQIQESSASTSDAYDFSWLDPGKKIFVLQK